MKTNHLPLPPDPIAAVTHSNPYPYYADLVKNKPIYYDTDLELWVASSADIVESVLTNNIYRVRPVRDPVPANLLGSPAADIYRHLIRMNDGDYHRRLKGAVLACLAQIDMQKLTELSRRWAKSLLPSRQIRAELQDYIFQLPVYVIASLLGLPDQVMPRIAAWTNELVQCFAQNSKAEQIDSGKKAAEELLGCFRSFMPTQQAAYSDSLLSILSKQARIHGSEDDNEIIANSIGFLSQAYEATAGLMGNTLLAISSSPIPHEQIITNSDLLRHIIDEVLRYDPPIQNTRRFMAEDGVIAGEQLREGEIILVVLAAANRDTTFNANPDEFKIHRANRFTFTFGMGLHACPGEILAKSIATAGIEQLLISGFDPKSIVGPTIYRPSANARIPIWIS
jgi:cytochrome P450